MPIRKLFLMCELALVLVLGYVIVSTLLNPSQTVEIFTPGSAGGSESGSDNMDINTSPPLPACSAIVDRNIFVGDKERGSQQQGPSSDNDAVVFKSAEEELGLELAGIIAGKQTISRAIIKNTRNRTLDLYKVGQNVGGATLEKIEQGMVILIHNGERKILRYKGAGRVDIDENKTSILSNTPQEISDVPVKDTNEAKTENTATDNMSMADRLGTLLRQADIEPYMLNGAVDGLKISGLDKVPGAQNIGLKDGDIIKTVNGHQLISKQTAFQVFMKAKSQPTMNIEIIRDNKKRKVSFSLK